MSDTLFPIEPTLSPRLRWIARHGIKTERHQSIDEWTAWSPESWATEDDSVGIGQYTGSGATEDDALTDLAKRAGINLWMEE